MVSYKFSSNYNGKKFDFYVYIVFKHLMLFVHRDLSYFLSLVFFSPIFTLNHISVFFQPLPFRISFESIFHPFFFSFLCLLLHLKLHWNICFLSVIYFRWEVLCSSTAKKDIFFKGLQHGLAFLTSLGVEFSLSAYVSIRNYTYKG